MNSFKKILLAFDIPTEEYTARPIISGHINTSYAVSNTRANDPIFFLQKINPTPFSSIKHVMNNIQRSLFAQQENSKKFLDTLKLIKTKNNDLYHIDNEGNHWRLFHYLLGYREIKRSDSPENICLMGKAYGAFIRQINTQNVSDFHITIPQFHALKQRLLFLQKAVENPYKDRLQHVDQLIEIVQKLGSRLTILDNYIDSGKIANRLCHNDTKCSNVMIHSEKEKLCVIDLDTVMPGSILYDYGDAIRSIVSNSAEDDNAEIQLQWKNQEAFHKGFVGQVGDFLSPLEMELLPIAMIYMPFIMGVRFLTDYLMGDVYFSSEKKKHNLYRAINQLSLSKKLADATNFI